MPAELDSALETLARFRAHGSRESRKTFDDGLLVLQHSATNKMGEERWAFLEQLALAAMDVGRIDVADTCIALLNDKFPDSPRVATLLGIHVEVTKGAAAAEKHYATQLEADPTNGTMWKRYITTLRVQSRLDVTGNDTKSQDIDDKYLKRTVDELCLYLDTFYNDIEGWLELADIYEHCGQYVYASQAVSHAMLLAPQNPFYALRSADLARRAGDVPLAAKMYLLVIDMTTDDDAAADRSPPVEVQRRAWTGIKETAAALLADTKLMSNSPSMSPAPSMTSLAQLEQLAGEQLTRA